MQKWVLGWTPRHYLLHHVPYGSQFGLSSAVKAIHVILLLPKLFRVMALTRLRLISVSTFSEASKWFPPLTQPLTKWMQWGGFEFILQSLQSAVDALCTELDKATISNLFPRSSQPAPGTREISPEANPTVPNLGTGLDRISREAAVWVLRRGVTAQEAGWGCLRPWGHPAVPIEGVVPVGKVWLTCLILCGALPQLEKPQLLCGPHVISVTSLLCQCLVRLKIEGLRSPAENCHIERAADLHLLLPMAVTFM